MRKNAMSRPKTWIIGLAGTALVGAGLALLLWHRSAQNSYALLRILPPQADLYGWADLASLQGNPAVRRFLADPPDVSVEEDYKRFVEASGFRYQDDLRQLALAKLGSNWVGAARVTLDRSRIRAYLANEANKKTEVTPRTEKTEEEGQAVYVFGQARPFRLALPGGDLAVFTIGEDASLIGQALRRHFAPSADSGAAELMREEQWQRISQGNAVWLVGRMDRLLDPDGPDPAGRDGPFRFGGPLLRGSKALTVMVKSRLTRLEFEVENRCEDAAAAARIARTLQSLLILLRAAPAEESNPEPVKWNALLQDIAVQQVDDSVHVQWQWDAETLRNLQ
jgi:hypothetical protein